MCKHNIRFPGRWHWQDSQAKAHNFKNAFHKFHIPYEHRPDPHCGWVEEQIESMDEMEANHFFCESEFTWRNIFLEQASHLDLKAVPVKRINNLQTKCTKWVKKYGGKPPMKAPAPWLADFDDLFSWGANNLWRTIPLSLPVTILDMVKSKNNTRID
jgi:hypothetical protein